jgi:hypothetical protein
VTRLLRAALAKLFERPFAATLIKAIDALVRNVAMVVRGRVRRTSRWVVLVYLRYEYCCASVVLVCWLCW